MKWLPLAAALLRGRQEQDPLGTPVNASAADAAAAPLAVVADAMVQLELASADKRLVALALSNWTAAEQAIVPAFAALTSVPVSRFTLVSEMEGALTQEETLHKVQTSGKSVVSFAQVGSPPSLLFAGLSISPGMPADCNCPCMPGTPAHEVAALLEKALEAGPVGGFFFTFRQSVQPWAGAVQFTKPAEVDKKDKAVPHFDPAKEKVIAPAQALAFSNMTKNIVDQFETDEQAAAGRAADALSKSGREVPCTVTSPDGMSAPCIFPGKVSAEIPQDASA
jgi:hypothetical protein